MEIKIAKNAGFCFGVKRAMQMENTQLLNMRRKELEKMLGEKKALQLINKWKEE